MFIYVLQVSVLLTAAVSHLEVATDDRLDL